MSEIDWSKAPEGATHFCKENLMFYKDKLDRFHYWNDAEWIPASGPRTSYEDLIERPSSPAWSGEGRPPVGVVCEAIYNSHDAKYHKAKILAHDNGAIVFRWTDGDSCGLIAEYKDERPEVRGYAWFRPIRTPEQNAAEEREMAVMEIGTILIDNRGSCNEYHIAGLLYDAGYRKTGEQA